MPRKPVEHEITKEEAGAFIREKREQKGYRQVDIAALVGLPNENYMTFYERGKIDVRSSKYLPKLIAVLGITAQEMREHLGMELLINPETPGEETLDFPPNARRPEGAVLLPYLGTVQAGVPHNGKPQIAKGHKLVECPLPIARRYKPEDQYILSVNGDSMTCADVQRTIPAGASVLCIKYPGPVEPRPNKIVVAWIPELGPHGIGVIKKYGKGLKDEVVLESYNHTGPRFPARLYPEMKIQGVVLGFWVEFN